VKRHDVLASLIRTLVILNVIDSVCTLFLVGHRLTTEDNPLMDILLEKGSLTFGLAKTAIAILSAVMLWFSRKSKWAIPATISLLLVMSVVVFVQVVMLMQIGWNWR
jgi:hypothetical protein